MNELIIDSFAGGGGASLGISWALGRSPDVAINHDAAAIAMHKANHPETRHFTEDVWKVSPRAVTGGRPVGLLWASPDCKHFSRAKGAKPVEKKIRSLAWVVVKWAAESRPRVILLENVREFQEWGPLVPRLACGSCDWKGTEGQAKLARRRRACPRCDGAVLREMRDENRRPVLIPDPDRKGLTFRRFVGRLRAMGYKVEWRVMDAADYGAPTHRRRLFLAARCDGWPIVWPEPTHGDPKKIGKDLFSAALKPWRTAAECIDWSIPCPSIFERKRPLAEATMRRIAMGIKRYVLENPRPFIVGVGGRMGQSAAAPVDQPNNTVCAKNDRAVVTPFVVRCNHGGKDTWFRSRSIEEPMSTVVQSRGDAVLTPVLVGVGGPEYSGKPREADRPMGSLTTENHEAVVAPVLVGWRDKGSPRVLDLGAPHGAITAGGRQSALVAAFLAKHYGGVVGQPADAPSGTITAKDHHSLVAANLVHLNHGGKQNSSVEEPMRTVVSGGLHAALVYTFLTNYFGQSIGQSVDDPLLTATSKDHLGMVTVEIGGQPYVIVDIGMRMLTPRELARGQGFHDSYVLTGSQTSQVARIGNSVCPAMAEALVRANFESKQKEAVRAERERCANVAEFHRHTIINPSYLVPETKKTDDQRMGEISASVQIASAIRAGEEKDNG